ncbi:MAG: FmdB family transcriptional regulator [Actinobacteria bacterium]|nr:FmdB family transcriptional regulator [Actinomycetota bacterium]MSY51543.1 FmdB family transcriptional regulator [Actinomycetota bacterium]MSY86989.1 FmdB family transcriptional regulator [Actinomycetota bacterium]MTA50071.1 FmdB family transcriptional regulator [Actinomycetota bacterium]
MPTYPYACTSCEHSFEIVQSFSEDALTVCPECGGALRKLYSSVGIVFKGSGFYRTDSRGDSKGTSSTTAASTSSTSSAPAKSESTSSATESSSTSSPSTTTSTASTN